MNALLPITLCLSLLLATVHGGCFENWSRCTPATEGATGILWKSCPDFCSKCRGRASGSCQKVKTAACNGGYQCQCSGRTVAKTGNFLEWAACQAGL